MNMSVSIKNKLYTVAMVTLSLGMVLLTGCDVLGVGSIDPEALGDVAIVSGVPTQGSDETEVPAGAPSEDTDNAEEADTPPGEDADEAEAEAPVEDSDDETETPAEDTDEADEGETPGEDTDDTDDTETPDENSDEAEAPAEDSDDDETEAPAEDTDEADEGETPGEDADDTDDTEAPAEDGGNAGALSTDPANPTLWNAQQVYAQQGYYVSHNGKTYESQWWVQGNEPGAAEWNGWRAVNSDGSYVVYLRPGQSNISDWSETTAYPGANYYVRYNGVAYRSKWYANAGETPGVAAVWERVE